MVPPCMAQSFGSCWADTTNSKGTPHDATRSDQSHEPHLCQYGGTMSYNIERHLDAYPDKYAKIAPTQSE